jgi:formylmethanofuran dehydrogenase subunit D
MKCILISGRTTKQGTSLELGKTSQEYAENVAVIMMNEDDMKELGVEEGKPVRVSTELGSTVVRCTKSKLDRGIVFMPFGPWVSLLTGADTQGTGMPDSKGIEVEISATDEGAQTISDILEMMRGTQ